MAAPITEIARQQPTEEEVTRQKLEELEKLVADHKDAFENLIRLIDDFNDTGALEAANAMILAKNDILKIVLEQLSREQVVNLINMLLGTAGVFMKADHDLIIHLMNGVSSGFDEGKQFIGSEEKVTLFGLLKSLSDPDVNRAVGFAISFLKGMGKALQEPVPKKEDVDNETLANI